METLRQLLGGAIRDDVNPAVFGFFALAGILTLALSIFYLRYYKIKRHLFFGGGLLLVAISFGLWSYVAGTRPEWIGLFVGIGVVIFLGALILFFLSYLDSFKDKKSRTTAITVAAIILVALLALRFVFLESHPNFSDDGFFSFQTNQITLYAFVVALAFSIAPAAYAIAAKVKRPALTIFIRFGFTVLTIGTAILITSPDNYLQIINGVGILCALVLLITVHALVPLEEK
jgi:hypothetical protein